ncbi:MAG: IPT/TIG domain-containing protein, partial [Candidatus Cryptobacteroides sp.]
MKNISIFCASLALVAALSSCKKEPQQLVNTPAFDTSTLSPKTDESGTVRAYIGTEVTAKGFNLDKVSSVTFSDVETEIVSQSINSITFTVPQLELAQQDDPHCVILKAFGEDPENHIFKTNFYVTVPVTDALVSGYSPATGTIGTEVTIKGRNLEQVTSVSFGSASVSSESFVSQDGAQIVVAVPAVAWSSANEELGIKAFWGEGREIDVTGESVFILIT